MECWGKTWLCECEYFVGDSQLCLKDKTSRAGLTRVTVAARRCNHKQHVLRYGNNKFGIIIAGDKNSYR